MNLIEVQSHDLDILAPFQNLLLASVMALKMRCEMPKSLGHLTPHNSGIIP